MTGVAICRKVPFTVVDGQILVSRFRLLKPLKEATFVSLVCQLAVVQVNVLLSQLTPIAAIKNSFFACVLRTQLTLEQNH